MSEYLDLAIDLARAKAAELMHDDPNRVAPYEYVEPPPAFEELSLRAQLDIAETVCRRDPFFSARDEMLVESAQYQSWVSALLDSSVSNERVGLMARKFALAYLQRVAVNHCQDLADFA